MRIPVLLLIFFAVPALAAKPVRFRVSTDDLHVTSYRFDPDSIEVTTPHQRFTARRAPCRRLADRLQTDMARACAAALRTALPRKGAGKTTEIACNDKTYRVPAASPAAKQAANLFSKALLLAAGRKEICGGK